jgi:hypothetical protein
MLALLVSTGGIVAGAMGPALEAGDRLWPTVWLLWGVVGYLILIKRPGNGVGVAALTVGVTWGVGFGMLTLSAVYPGASFAVWAEMINVILGVVPWLAIVWLLLVFPSGTLAGKGERLVAIALVVIGVVITLGFTLSPEPMETTGQPSPLAIPAFGDLAAVITSDESFWALVVLVFATLLLIVLRWRRSEGVERLQHRWLAMGTLAFLLSVSAGQLAGDDTPGELVWFLGGAAIPVSIGIAILRYRLFEIDRLISRTVSYVIVVGVLAAVFAGVVALAGSYLETESDFVVASSTLAVAALFNPLRRRVQSAVDRRFNRSRYDAERIIAGFTGTLRDEVDPIRVIEGWVGVASDTMQPASAGVWVRER